MQSLHPWDLLEVASLHPWAELSTASDSGESTGIRHTTGRRFAGIADAYACSPRINRPRDSSFLITVATVRADTHAWPAIVAFDTHTLWLASGFARQHRN